MFLPRCCEAMPVIQSERPAKAPYQKSTPPAERLEPAIVRIQIQALYQLSYSGPQVAIVHVSDQNYIRIESH